LCLCACLLNDAHRQGPSTKGTPLNHRDIWRPEAGDLALALGLLTRAPIPVSAAHAARRGAAPAWAWPVVGALVGAVGAAAGALALWAGLAPPLAAAAVVIAQVMLTGALHEDGLADTADGLWGGWDRARRLAIMKDSQIGTYGLLALLLVTLIRWLALTMLVAATDWAAIIAAGAISRAPMAAIMAALPNARDGGLSHRVGRPPQEAVVTACLLAAVAGAALIGTALLPATLTVVILCGWLSLTARARIGGQTGDILGASQQLAELAVLVVATMRVAP
jgi:adenosylcobinamide-GDP ribazoletransferase